ncbi:hypothetical protein CN692_06220 [Bacillus sp. AFS002410]|uniref:hypothetical protein n=1 Tax=Bacillus sp. AFS002410 TaxID=2033481 RepID=UPI000BEF5702|nr:hypothetical protein [Bacillus sp. AFS002410]PEJ59072.1 hypothetical protein CN692_06220 [Bacillus sp. AFS002410]
MEYYPFLFIIKQKEFYCIWYSEDKDGFVTENNKVKFFETEKMLFDYAKLKNIEFMENKITSFSIDQAINWLTRKNAIIKSDYFLDFWNLITDLAYSVGDNFYGDAKEEAIHKVYDKLFWGNNLPAVTPKGKKFKPVLEYKQRKILVDIVKDGIRIINSLNSCIRN